MAFNTRKTKPPALETTKARYLARSRYIYFATISFTILSKYLDAIWRQNSFIISIFSSLLGIYATVLHALNNMNKGLLLIAKDDVMGRRM